MKKYYKNYQVYQYNNIPKLLTMYERNQTKLEEVILYTKKFLNVFKDLNLVVDLEQNHFDAYIVQQISKLNELRNNSSSWTELVTKYPLWGVPILVKDNVDIKDMATTSGSKYFENNIAKSNCLAVEKLTKLGAIVIAKTNLSEFSGMSAQHGISQLGGKSVNPLESKWDTSGSSSGSAISASLGLPLNIGTETFGSILSPSVCCHVIGWKPEQFLLTDDKNIPISHHYDTVGIITNTNENLQYIAKSLGITKHVNKKQILIEKSTFLTSTGLDFWIKDTKQILKMFAILESHLQDLGYEVKYHNLGFFKGLSLYKKVASTMLTHMYRDFNTWDKENKYSLESYLQYTQELPDHIDFSKIAKLLDKKKEEKYLKNLNTYYRKYYHKYSAIIGGPTCATLISSLNQNPALSVPITINNDKIVALSICAQSSQELLELNEIIENIKDNFIISEHK